MNRPKTQEDLTQEALVELEDATAALQHQIGKLRADFLTAHGWTFDNIWSDRLLWSKRINGRVVLSATAREAVEIEVIFLRE